MEVPYKQFFLSYAYGLSSMTYFHNFFVSVFLYRSGIANVTNILKIIFNLSGVTWSAIRYNLLMAVSIYHCRVLIYLEVFTNFLYRETLAAFLLWRLKQIEYSAWDRWISFALFTFRTVLNLIVINYYQPILDSDEYLQECKSDSEVARYIQLGYISIDVLIDFFVTVRLVQILNEGNRNSAQANSIIGRRNPKRTLFTAVLYWNFMRMTVDFIYNVMAILNIYIDNDKFYFEVLNGIQCFATIAQSYLITVDAEIVKVIEGNQNRTIIIAFDRNNLSIVSFRKFIMSTPSTSREMEEGERDSIKPSSFTSISTSNSSSQTSGSKSQKHKSWRRDSLNRQQKTASFRLNKNKFVVVSMQRLTFFEWANLIISDDKKENIRSSDEVLGLLDNCDPPAMVHISQSRRELCKCAKNDPSLTRDKLAKDFEISRSTVSVILSESNKWLSVDETVSTAQFKKNRQANWRKL
nr:6962_t:CDS:2 [Entrophospora candida]